CSTRVRARFRWQRQRLCRPGHCPSPRPSRRRWQCRGSPPAGSCHFSFSGPPSAEPTDAHFVPSAGSKQEKKNMDWNRVEGNWKQIKGKIKEQWGKLTDDDLDQIAGKRDQLEGKIQERYGIEKDRVRREVDDWYGRQGW